MQAYAIVVRPWPTSLARIPCRFSTMVGEVEVYLSVNYTSMIAKFASSAQFVRNAPMPMRVGDVQKLSRNVSMST
jgi:hypothetical protein